MATVRRIVVALTLFGILAFDSAFASGNEALVSLKEGDCKRAGNEINEGMERNEARAFFAAGCRYDEPGCVDADPVRAERYYRRAIELGDKEAGKCLGLMYGLGRGVAQDYFMAGGAFGPPSQKGSREAIADSAGLRAYGYAMTATQLARARAARCQSLRRATNS